jgi:hypothetical protein
MPLPNLKNCKSCDVWYFPTIFNGSIRSVLWGGSDDIILYLAGVFE